MRSAWRNCGGPRIRTVVGLLQKLRSLVTSFAGDALSYKVHPQRVDEVHKIEAELEKLTRRYVTWPRYCAESDGSGAADKVYWNHAATDSNSRAYLSRY